jgi:Flp pilus assembly protein TadG
MKKILSLPLFLLLLSSIASSIAYAAPARLSTNADAEADLAVSVNALTTRVDPGEIAEFAVHVYNNIDGNVTPQKVRVDYSVTNGVIERIDPQSAFCTITGATATCTGSTFSGGALPERRVFVRTSADLLGGRATLTVRASSELPDRTPDNDRASTAAAIYRWLVVRTAQDDDSSIGLRNAIVQANFGCTPGPCRIVFQIPGPVPPEGYFTITPILPLPAITADRISIEGTRQTALTGDTNPRGPEIAIDGRFVHTGLKVLSRCEAIVEGLALGNFDADQGLWVNSAGDCTPPSDDRRSVEGNHIGVDPTGTIAWPNLRGLRVDGRVIVERNVISENRYSGIWAWDGDVVIRANRIAHNGASGILLGPEITNAELLLNTISNHRDMGVAVARGAKDVDIRENSMRDNAGLGIDWGLDGVSPVNADDHNAASNAPVAFAATYDAASNTTNVTVSVQSSALGPVSNAGVLDFYANAAPDGDGETWIGAQVLNNFDQTVTVGLTGDLRGKWINATWTRVHWNSAKPPDVQTQSFAGGEAVTSELSNSVQVTP